MDEIGGADGGHDPIDSVPVNKTQCNSFACGLVVIYLAVNDIYQNLFLKIQVPTYNVLSSY
jgi:hypothetical protein